MPEPSLHPTPTRLALLRHVLNGDVIVGITDDTQGDVWLIPDVGPSSKVSARMAELERVGWVEHVPPTVSFAGCCEICDTSTPQWRLDRRGDAVVSWACDQDLATVMHRLQRDWEITEVVVSHSGKRREWAAITTLLAPDPERLTNNHEPHRQRRLCDRRRPTGCVPTGRLARPQVRLVLQPGL